MDKSLDVGFLEAAACGRLKEVRRVLSEQPDAALQTGLMGMSAGHIAAYYGQGEILRELHEQVPAILSARTEDGQTLAHSAAASGSCEILDFICKLDIRLVAATDHEGWTAAHVAAFYNQADALRFLSQVLPSLLTTRNCDGLIPKDVADIALRSLACRIHRECVGVAGGEDSSFETDTSFGQSNCQNENNDEELLQHTACEPADRFEPANSDIQAVGKRSLEDGGEISMQSDTPKRITEDRRSEQEGKNENCSRTQMVTDAQVNSVVHDQTAAPEPESRQTSDRWDRDQSTAGAASTDRKEQTLEWSHYEKNEHVCMYSRKDKDEDVGLAQAEEVDFPQAETPQPDFFGAEEPYFPQTEVWEPDFVQAEEPDLSRAGSSEHAFAQAEELSFVVESTQPTDLALEKSLADLLRLVSPKVEQASADHMREFESSQEPLPSSAGTSAERGSIPRHSDEAGKAIRHAASSSQEAAPLSAEEALVTAEDLERTESEEAEATLRVFRDAGIKESAMAGSDEEPQQGKSQIAEEQESKLEFKTNKTETVTTSASPNCGVKGEVEPHCKGGPSAHVSELTAPSDSTSADTCRRDALARAAKDTNGVGIETQQVESHVRPHDTEGGPALSSVPRVGSQAEPEQAIDAGSFESQTVCEKPESAAVSEAGKSTIVDVTAASSVTAAVTLPSESDQVESTGAVRGTERIALVQPASVAQTAEGDGKRRKKKKAKGQQGTKECGSEHKSRRQTENCEVEKVEDAASKRGAGSQVSEVTEQRDLVSVDTCRPVPLPHAAKKGGRDRKTTSDSIGGEGGSETVNGTDSDLILQEGGLPAGGAACESREAGTEGFMPMKATEESIRSNAGENGSQYGSEAGSSGVSASAASRTPDGRRHAKRELMSMMLKREDAADEEAIAGSAETSSSTTTMMTTATRESVAKAGEQATRTAAADDGTVTTAGIVLACQTRENTAQGPTETANEPSEASPPCSQPHGSKTHSSDFESRNAKIDDAASVAPPALVSVQHVPLGSEKSHRERSPARSSMVFSPRTAADQDGNSPASEDNETDSAKKGDEVEGTQDQALETVGAREAKTMQEGSSDQRTTTSENDETVGLKPESFAAASWTPDGLRHAKHEQMSMEKSEDTADEEAIAGSAGTTTMTTTRESVEKAGERTTKKVATTDPVTDTTAAVLLASQEPDHAVKTAHEPSTTRPSPSAFAASSQPQASKTHTSAVHSTNAETDNIAGLAPPALISVEDVPLGSQKEAEADKNRRVVSTANPTTVLAPDTAVDHAGESPISQDGETQFVVEEEVEETQEDALEMVEPRETETSMAAPRKRPKKLPWASAAKPPPSPSTRSWNRHLSRTTAHTSPEEEAGQSGLGNPSAIQSALDIEGATGEVSHNAAQGRESDIEIRMTSRGAEPTTKLQKENEKEDTEARVEVPAGAEAKTLLGSSAPPFARSPSRASNKLSPSLIFDAYTAGQDDLSGSSGRSRDSQRRTTQQLEKQPSGGSGSDDRLLAANTTYALNGQIDVATAEQEGKWKALLKGLRKGDITNMLIPVDFIRAESSLERVQDIMQHGRLLEDVARPRRSALDRMLAVVRFQASTVIQAVFDGKKPYNPVLGETCAWAWRHPDGRGISRMVCEQVSHHPPISAVHLHNETLKVTLHGYAEIVPKFTGNSVVVPFQGERRLILHAAKEEYEMSYLPNLVYRGLLVGSRGAEWTGRVTIRCEKTGLECHLEFKPLGWLGMWGAWHQVEGSVVRAAGGARTVLGSISGRWDRQLSFTPAHRGAATAQVYAFAEAAAQARLEVTPTPAATLPTDSQVVWRRLTRALKAGDLKNAAREKRAVEQAQRSIAAARKARGEVFAPSFFQLCPRWEARHGSSAQGSRWVPRTDAIAQFHAQRMQVQETDST